jgi:hypothetical protein
VSGRSVFSLSPPHPQIAVRTLIVFVLHPLNAFTPDVLSRCLHLVTINVYLLYVMRIYFL